MVRLAELTAVYTGILGFCGAEILLETVAVSKTVIFVISPAANEDTMIFFSGDSDGEQSREAAIAEKDFPRTRGTLNEGTLRQR